MSSDLQIEGSESHGSATFGEEESPFFADMTLDLAEAHDIAETPEPAARKVIGETELTQIPRMPTIDDDEPPETATSSVLPPTIQMSTLLDVADDEFPPDELEMQSNFRSITSNMTPGHSSGFVNSNSRSGPPSSRRGARDFRWAIGFCILVPLSLLLPMVFSQRPQNNASEKWMANATAPRLATLHTLLWGYIAALILSRLLYRTMGGGDGDDARHMISKILLASAPISVSVYISVVLTMYFLTPKAMVYAIIPLWYLARDVYLFRQWKMTATTPGGRQAFFEALTCMSLDILSRSLRRSSFYRMVSLLLVVQLLTISWWRWALLAALRSESPFWIVSALLGGKWATGTVARLLSLIASGGVHSWFEEQNSLVEEMSEKQKAELLKDEEEETIEFAATSNDTARGNQSRENGNDDDDAYRSAEASAYQSSYTPDEGLDDDFQDEEDMVSHSQNNTYAAPSVIARTANVKQFLFNGMTVSLGSVAKCGLLGGLAQLLWSQLRKIDTARATFGNFRGMDIGDGLGDETAFHNGLQKVNSFARDFVRNHSDLAMSHVAAYKKSYQRAAQDVSVLIDESGVEPIIHDDISTHMSACVGGSVSGLIVIFTGAVLVRQRNKNSPDVEDTAVLFDMVLAFVFCYTLIFTVMEPLRAAIKAAYVSFAQYPQALSQAFPLIHHRLTRMSRSNLR